MKVAYLILAHNQPELLKEFVMALHKPKEQIFVHVDKRTDIQPLKTLLQDQCVFIEQREKVYWAGLSQVTAYINLLKHAFAKGDFDYYSFHSGVDFPIKPVHAFEGFLNEHNGSEFMSMANCNLSENRKRRFNGYYLFKNRSKFFLYLNFGVTKIQRYLYKRKPYKGKEMFYGSSWWTLTHNCVNYILNKIDNEKTILKYFKYVFAPDEMFFQTIIGNSPFADKVANNNLRYIRFQRNNPNPDILTIKDKEVLLTSSAFFARKFDIKQSKEILDDLKQTL
jgi:hypothetical protein